MNRPDDNSADARRKRIRATAWTMAIVAAAVFVGFFVVVTR